MIFKATFQHTILLYTAVLFVLDNSLAFGIPIQSNGLTSHESMSTPLKPISDARYRLGKASVHLKTGLHNLVAGLIGGMTQPAAGAIGTFISPFNAARKKWREKDAAGARRETANMLLRPTLGVSQGVILSTHGAMAGVKRTGKALKQVQKYMDDRVRLKVESIEERTSRQRENAERLERKKERHSSVRARLRALLVNDARYLAGAKPATWAP